MSMLNFEPFSQYILHCSLYQVWEWIKTVTKWSTLINAINKDLIIEPILISCDMTYEVQSKFKCCYKDIINLDFIVDKMIETDYYCMIQWSIMHPEKEGRLNFSFTLTIHLHYISVSHTHMTAHVKTNYQYKPPNVRDTETKGQLQQYLQSIERCVLSKNPYNYNIESRIIKAPLSVSITYFENAKICTGLIGKVVSATENEIKKGTIVISSQKTMIYEGQNEQMTIQVRKCISRSTSYKASFYIYKKNENTPIRSMQTELFQINENDTLAMLTHHYFTIINETEYLSHAKGKKKFLKKLGKIIETLNEKSLSSSEDN